MKFKTLHTNNRQNGMALILAIGFLAVLSILGAVVLRVSTQDLKATASLEPRRQAFYVADRAVEYAMNRDIIYSLTSGGEVVLADGGTHQATIERDGVGTLTAGTVTFIPSEDLAMPDQLAELHGNDFGVVLYHVNVKAKAALGATANIDASIVRLFKKDDDQIFRTSGGG
ncbi:MAG: pilus assembly PilX N-terminal domain-containing protein [Desulfuromonadales bacterium]|nr:pilus assembly PilX N-terminal domain-containing protein [Desulfuromonadales bacterium]